PVQEGVWGGTPPGVWGEAPSYILTAKPPRCLERSTNRHGPLPPPPFGYAAVHVPENAMLPRDIGENFSKPVKNGVSRSIRGTAGCAVDESTSPTQVPTFGCRGTFSENFSLIGPAVPPVRMVV
ncbi:MAG: hypothetical protein GY696_25220, partial [Gammaproteobacteria bacterium]|nr:hypothetical protein [Gammaproteobacteria bacterium]